MAFGGWATIGSPYSAEILSAAGLDWVGIDMQHGLVGFDRLPEILQALAIRRTPSLVRVPWNTQATIMQALDAGAHGVIVPFVNSASEAKDAVSACRYPPGGVRSWGLLRASLSSGAYDPEAANAATICGVMVETVQAIDSVESIARVPGVDAVIVGPRDLMLSAQTSTQLEATDASIDLYIERVVQACEAAGVIPGAFAPTREIAARWAGLGVRMIIAQSDSALLIAAAAELTEYLRASVPADR